MPRFSVIVPAYQVQAFLPECLDSVLSQSFKDFEVIAVDDASPDDSGKILDEYAASDDRVRVLHLPENVGLGHARNTGVGHATGDYVLFLDSDDAYLQGTLEALAARLSETGDPDIVVFDYARVYPSGAQVRNERAALLARQEPDVFDVLDRPELLRLLAVVWNKAYRRDFVERAGLAFPSGYYEDVAWTYPAMLAAERIACLDRICVHYRQRNDGNILGTESRRHFDLFDQYERVFAFLESRPEVHGLRHLLFRRAVDHVCAVLNMPRRVPRRARRAFFRRGHELYRRHLPAGYTPPSGVAGVRHRLLGAGTPLLYQALLHTRRVWLRTRSLTAATPPLRPPGRPASTPAAPDPPPPAPPPGGPRGSGALPPAEASPLHRD